MFTFPVGFFGGSTGDPYWSNVVLYLPFTGTNGQTTFTDVSQYGHTVTRNGDTVISTAQFPSLTGVGSSAYLDGGGDYLSIPDNSLFNFDADFTIEGFSRRTNVTTDHAIIAKWGYLNDNWLLRHESSGKFRFWYVGGFIETALTYAANQWHYFGITRSGSTLSIRVNGDPPATASTTVNLSNSRVVTVGSYGNISGEGNFYSGNISHFRITKGIARDVSTVPTTPFSIG